MPQRPAIGTSSPSPAPANPEAKTKTAPLEAYPMFAVVFQIFGVGFLVSPAQVNGQSPDIFVTEAVVPTRSSRTGTRPSWAPSGLPARD